MSSGPPSKPLMSQNPSLRGPLLACSRRATDDCNRRRPPSAHAHAPTECSSVPRSSHLCHAPTPPQIPPVTTPSSPSSFYSPIDSGALAVKSLSKCVKSPAGPRPLVNPRQSPAAHRASCQCVKIRQNPSNLGPRSGPYYPPHPSSHAGEARSCWRGVRWAACRDAHRA